MRGKFIRDRTGFLVSRKFIISSNDKVSLSASNDEPGIITLYRLEADEPGKGHGGRELEKLKRYARRVKKNIELIAVADSPDYQSRLNRFYVRHGFVTGNDSIWCPIFVYNHQPKKSS